MQTRGTYAARTDVTVERSIDEARAVLRRYGVEEIAVAESPAGRLIAWRDRGAGYRLNVARPGAGAKAEQQERQQWRALVLVLKAMLETAPVAGLDVDALLLPYRVLPDGRTVAESAPQIEAAGWAALLTSKGG